MVWDFGTERPRGQSPHGLYAGIASDACGPACLEMRATLAALTLPEACGSEERCIGLCADNAIHMAWIPWVGDTGRGKWRDASH